MPLNIAPVPYRGDQYLFQGISGAGQNIAEGIEGMTKRLRQTKAMRTMAVDGMGMDPDKVDNMTPEQIQGIMQGMAVKNAQKEAAARVEMEQAHAQYFKRFNLKADAEGRFSDEVNQYMQPQPPAPMAPGDQGPQQPAQMPNLDPQTLMRLEAKAGTLDPDKAMQYMKQLQGGATQTPTMFDEDPVTGSRFARHNGSIMPSGMDPKMIAASGPQTSADDNFYFDGKKWNTLKNKEMTDADKAKLMASRESEIDKLVIAKQTSKANGTLAPEDLEEINGRIARHTKAIEALDTATPGQPAAAKQMTPDLAKQYLQKAGGDKNKARGLAKADGYTF